MTELVVSLFARGASLVRAIIGAPDYARYLQHMRTAHPGERVMSETEFNHSRMNDRYNRPGSRCC
jgi:uncharacterized short protein YbdD (DUF466 family)